MGSAFRTHDHWAGRVCASATRDPIIHGNRWGGRGLEATRGAELGRLT